MDQSFETRVWMKALDRGLLSTRQVNECLRESDTTAPTLRLTEILVAKGFLKADQVTEIRREIALAEPESPKEVRAAAKDPRSLIGRYVAVEELGRGGMGVVYKAWDGDLRRYVALKVLSGPWGDEDLARFRREAQSAAALRHPNIITVYEISPSDESPYIALELIDGRTLAGRKQPVRKAAELMVVIARAVEAAHRSGIIHRDLKPHNIMVDAEGRPRVMDFGLAKPLRSSSQITVSGTVMGTPAYMAPEQAQGRVKDVDHRSDIFSLGGLLYELLTGQAPFGGKTPLATLTSVVECKPVAPTRLAPSIPRPLEAIILTCLQKEKSRRYSSAEALARDLERFLNGEKVMARVPMSLSRLTFALGAAIAVAAGLVAVCRPAPQPVAPLPPPPPRLVAARPADRTHLDRGVRLLEEARLDLYRAGVGLTVTHAKLREAERCLDAALQADPQSGAGYLARGEVRTRLHRLEAALPDFTEAIRRLPTSPAVYIARGRLLLERYMREMGTSAWVREELPDEVRLWVEQAREDFHKARDLSPSQDDLPFLQTCMALVGADYLKAIDLATRAIPGAARPEEFYKLRGDAHQARASLDTQAESRAVSQQKAAEDYSQAIVLRANYADAYRQRGAMLWHLRRGNDALKDFQAVLEMDPQDSRALSDVGTFHYHAQKLDLALDFYARAIAADGRNYRALTNRGSVYTMEKRYAEARKDLEQALRTHPHHLPAQYNLAVALDKLGERVDAIRRLDEILIRAPKFTRALAYRGVIYYERGQWKEALIDMERAVGQDPTHATVFRNPIEICRSRLRR